MSDTEDTIDSMANMIAHQREQIESLTHALANERQVVADLRETNQQLCEQVGHLNAGCVRYERVVEAARAWRASIDDFGTDTHDQVLGAAIQLSDAIDALDAEDGQ